MKTIDEQFSEFNDINSTNSVKRVAVLSASVICLNLLECLLLTAIYLCLGNLKGAILASLAYMIVSNLELAFYSIFIWFIYTRVSVIKSQIEVLYSINRIPQNYKESTVHPAMYKSL